LSIESETRIPASALDDKVKPRTAMGHPVERVAPGLLRESIIWIE
jgi:hypothetical protein